MKVIPLAVAHAQQAAQTSPEASKGQSARDRALSMLAGTEAPVSNQSAVSAEEMSSASTGSPEASKDPAPEGALADAVASSEASQDSAIEGQEPEEVKAPSPKEDPATASKFAQLARREKAILAKMEAAKASEASLAAREEAIRMKEADFTSSGKYIPKDRLLNETSKVLQEQGISYDKLVQEQLATEATPEQKMIEEMRAEIKAMRQEQEDGRKAQAESQDKSYKQAVAQISKDVKNLVDNDPEFESISKTGQHGEVVKLIEMHYHETGELMEHAEAARQIEQEIEEELYKHASSIEKIKKRLAAASALSQKQTPAQTPGAPAKQNQQQPIKTLTNSMSTSRQLTARQRAELAFKGEKF